MRIGIIGLQNGHHYHLVEGARQLGDCEIVAVSDSDEGAVKQFIADQPLAKNANPYGDWRHLVEHSMLDVCYLSDENGLRAEQLLPLLALGVDIVAEKPLATTWEDFARVKVAMGKSKSRVTMMLTMRHEPKYVTLKTLVADGAIGDVRQISTQKSYRLGERPEWQKHRASLGGLIPYIGVHALDLMTWTTGLKYESVAALHVGGVIPNLKETEDSASLLLGLRGGATATSRLDYLRPMTAPTHGDDRIRIAGTRGVIEAVGERDDLLLLSVDAAPQRIKPESTDNLFASFIRALRDDVPPRITAADSLYATELVLAARQAADQRRIMTFDEADKIVPQK